ncbi:hypothetical protein K435DRAFT_217758 [Dendrothele bispora CBS 962.96]|uniref:Uncharacterized protein n=1 Tax=Dendrothele bispora (strain CBS 962.96) TaxID=1314807 RepID=A0A4S8KJW3_DENBC|nr:hypothetical protein K435DRAFT_217758 [Dendrothele bispora CBS 962.96]
MAAKKNSQRRNTSQTASNRSIQPMPEPVTQLGPVGNPVPNATSLSVNLTPSTVDPPATVAPNVTASLITDSSNTVNTPVITSNTGAVSTQAVVQANTVPTYAQIASRPPSPRPRSPALTRPTTPTGNRETVQTVRHSMHAPPEPDTSLATPTSIAQDGYPDDGFTTVERRKKDKGSPSVYVVIGVLKTDEI